jgi:hypothetical protein
MPGSVAKNILTTFYSENGPVFATISCAASDFLQQSRIPGLRLLHSASPLKNISFVTAPHLGVNSEEVAEDAGIIKLECRSINR